MKKGVIENMTEHLRRSTPLIASSLCFNILSIRAVSSMSFFFSFCNVPRSIDMQSMFEESTHLVELGALGNL